MTHEQASEFSHVSSTVSSSSNSSAMYSMGSSIDVGTVTISIAPTKTRKLQMRNLTSSLVARAIIGFCAEHGDLVTNLRLQRLLYYVQAWHLALHDATLFDEDFEAWASGPIEPLTYAEYSAFNSAPIKVTQVNVEFPKKLMSHIGDVMEAYGSISAFDLERLSKDEEPWKAANASWKDRAVIKKDLMKDFYKMKHAHAQRDS